MRLSAAKCPICGHLQKAWELSTGHHFAHAAESRHRVPRGGADVSIAGREPEWAKTIIARSTCMSLPKDVPASARLRPLPITIALAHFPCRRFIRADENNLEVAHRRTFSVSADPEGRQARTSGGSIFPLDKGWGAMLASQPRRAKSSATSLEERMFRTHCCRQRQLFSRTGCNGNLSKRPENSRSSSQKPGHRFRHG